MEWYNEPAVWRVEDDRMVVKADGKTDFWQKTHYGFQRDNGHFYSREVSGDFTASVKVSGQYATLYDQAGLMVRLSETHWMKCGIEFVNEMQNASAVVTHEFSDWSVVPLYSNPPSVYLRVKRGGDALEVFYSLDDVDYTMIRTAYMPTQNPIQVGVMCAAPEGDGFSVTFEGFSVETD